MEPEIEIVKTSELKEFEGNAKIHTEAQIEHIKKSITEFGFVQPVVVDENNVILAGHGRCLAAQSIGMKKIPVIRKVGLTDAEKLTLNVADNKLQHETGMDPKILRAMLTDLDDGSFNFTEFGLELKPIDENEFKVGAQSDMNDGSVRQLAVLFDAALFEIAVARFDAISKQVPELENNTMVFIKLVEEFKC